MTNKQEEGNVVHSPQWTNPYIGMCALISAAVNSFGKEGERVMIEALRNLGLKTGEYMIREGLVLKDSSVETWGKLTEQLLDLTGITNHECIESSPDRYSIKVKGCVYPEPYAYLKAPHNICNLKSLESYNYVLR